MRKLITTTRFIGLICLGLCVGCTAEEEAAPSSGGASVGTSLQEEAAAAAAKEAPPEPEEPVKEDDGTRGLDESYEGTQANARVNLSFDSESNMFKGTVENMARDDMSQVNITVTLSTGAELKTSVENIESGSRREIELSSDGNEFERWSVTASTGADAEAESPSGDEDPNN